MYLEIIDLYNELRIFIEDMLSTSVREGNSCPGAFLVIQLMKKRKRGETVFLLSFFINCTIKAQESIVISH